MSDETRPHFRDVGSGGADQQETGDFDDRILRSFDRHRKQIIIGSSKGKV